MKIPLLILLIVLSVSCNSQEKKTTETKNPTEQENAVQIGQYVVEIFQDTKGNLWFGTLEKGVAKYDGKSWTYLTTKDGLPSNRVTSVVEDKLGNVCF